MSKPVRKIGLEVKQVLLKQFAFLIFPCELLTLFHRSRIVGQLIHHLYSQILNPYLFPTYTELTLIWCERSNSLYVICCPDVFSFEHLFARRSIFRPSSLLNKSFAVHRTQNNAHEMSTGHPNRPSATKEEFLVKIRLQ